MNRTVGGRWRVVLVSALVAAVAACGRGGGGPDDGYADDLPGEATGQDPTGNLGGNNGGNDGDDQLGEQDPGAVETPDPGEVVTAPDESKAPKDKVCLPPTKVALEGQKVPCTRWKRFDDKFKDPKTNNQGNVTFRATFDNYSQAGIFAWSLEHEKLTTVAKTGDWTKAGPLPWDIRDWSGPAFNDKNEIAFSVRNIGNLNMRTEAVSDPAAMIPIFGGSALFQAILDHHDDGKDEKKCDLFKLKVLARTGDCAPKGGLFDEFGDVAENDKGDVAFIATFGLLIINGEGPGPAVAPEAEAIDEELSAELSAAGLSAAEFNMQPPIFEGVGVYVKRDEKKHDHDEKDYEAADFKRHCDKCDDLEKIVRTGDFLKGTWGQRFCGDELDDLRGPWINNKGDVLFIAEDVRRFCGPGAVTTVDTADQMMVPDLSGSLFIKRKGEKHARLFVGIGDRGPKGGHIEEIGMGQPAVNDEQATMFLEVEYNAGVDVAPEQQADALIRRERPEVFLVTKDLDEDRHEHEGKCAETHLKVCAYDGQKLTRKYELDLEVEDEDLPTIDSTGLIAFAGEAELKERNGPKPPVPMVEPAVAEQTATATGAFEIPYLPEEIDAIFTCKHQDLDVVVKEGDKKPVSWKDIFWKSPMVSASEEAAEEASLNVGFKFKHKKFRFGEVFRPSNDDDYVAFVDPGSEEARVLREAGTTLTAEELQLRESWTPAGVFISCTEEEE